uniref:Leucine-rich repeat domain-containing protein n=1 Tax=Parastrongyloides trichosuri TaxID=131310 RepID=A0A0N4ZNM5_PARTI
MDCPDKNKLNERKRKFFCETTKNKKSRKNDETTAAERVGRNDDIMKLIIGKISDVTERRNIMESCRTYYALGCGKEPYISLSSIDGNFKIPNTEKKYFINNNRTYKWPAIISNSNCNLVLPIQHFSYDRGRWQRNMINLLFRYRESMNKLLIRQMNSKCYDMYITANCFNNIKILEITPLVLSGGCLELINRCQSLKPHTLILFTNFYGARPVTIDDHGELFNTCIKNIILNSIEESELGCFRYFGRKFENFDENHFDLLDISKLDLRTIGYDKFLALKNILKYFKVVKIRLGHLYTTGVLYALLTDLNTNNLMMVNLDIDYSDSYYDRIHLLGIIHGVQIPHLGDNFQGILASLDIAPRIKSLKLEKFYYDYLRFDNGLIPDINFLCDDISRMENLSTLTINCNFLRDDNQLFKIGSSLNENLRNLKLTSCKNICRFELENISRNCKKLEKLELHDIEQLDIKLSDITNIFENLSGFSLYYSYERKRSEFIYDLIGKNKSLIWPSISFLQVQFTISKSLKKMLSEIDYNTPRKPGQFIFKELEPLIIEINGIKEYYDRCIIIIQDSTKRYDEFKNVFKN